MVTTAPVEQQAEEMTATVQPIEWAGESTKTEPLPEWHRREERIFFGFVLVALLVFIAAAVALWRVFIR